MQRFKKILFIHNPETTTTSSLQRAVNLARQNKAQLTICNVSAELPRTLPNIEKSFRQIHEAQINASLEQVDVVGISIKKQLLTGIAFIEIVNQVRRAGYDLVMKSAEGRGDLMGGLFGSTDMHLMRKCPCPVWIMKPTKRKKYARILAAVDPDPGIATNAELNKIILEMAISQARGDDSELHIVHAWDFPHEDMYRSKRVTQFDSDVDTMVQEKRKQHKENLDSLLDGFDLEDLKYKVHMLKGNAGHIISALAHKTKVELIVMGTVARTGIPGFFIGNTAEKVLSSVDCSVLTVKPKSFKTPVKG